MSCTPQCADDFVTGCQSYCAAIVTCDPEDGPFEECVTSCIAELAEEEPECQTLQCDAYACSGKLDCETLDNGSRECDVLWQKADELCSDIGDACFVGASGEMCSYACPGPPDLTLECDAMLCTCFEDGIQSASCPADGICDTARGISRMADACCGW